MSTDNATVSPSEDAVEAEEFDQASKAGWTRFLRFLLITVVLCAVGLLFVGALTVWS
jgi:hypothetical protein